MAKPGNINSKAANAIAAPDDTVTAEQYVATNALSGQHIISRTYTVTAFETFDSDAVKFDSDGETFDTGSASAGAAGGSGLVVVRGPSAVTFAVSPGTNSTSTHPGGDKIATFTVSGTLTVS